MPQDNKPKPVDIDVPQYLRGQMGQDPLLKGSALPSETGAPYYEAIGETDFGDSKYDKMTTTSIESIQNGDYKYFRGEQQSGLGQLGLGVLRLTSKAIIEAGKSPAYIYALGEWGVRQAKGEKDFTLDKALDNVVLNSLEGVDEGIKETLPVYQSYKSGKGGILDVISSTSFWASDGADGVGYLLGMIAPGAVIGKMGLANKLTKLGIGVDAKAMAALGKTTGLANDLELGTQTITNTLIEALAEGKGLADRLKSEGVSPEEIAERSKETFLANMAILLVPNAIMNKALLGRFSKDKHILDDFTDPKTGKLVNNPINKANTFKDYIKATGKGVGSEGFIEEGGQTSVENYEFNKGMNKTNADFLEGVAHEYLNTLGTTEGQKSIFLGAVLGGLGNAAGQYRENKQKEGYYPSVQELIDKNYQGFSVSNDPWVRNADGTIEIDPATNKPKIDYTKLHAGFKNYVGEIIDSQNRDIAALNNDIHLYEHLADAQFTRIAFPYVKEGEIGLETLNRMIDQSSKTRDMIDQEQLSKITGTSFDEAQYKQSLKAKAKQLQETYEGTVKIIAGLGLLKDIKGTSEQIDAFLDKLTNAVYQESAKQIFYKEKLSELEHELMKLNDPKVADLPQSETLKEEIIKTIKGFEKLLEKSKADYRSIFNKKQAEKAFKATSETDKILKDAKIAEEAAAKEAAKKQAKNNESNKDDDELITLKKNKDAALADALDIDDQATFDNAYNYLTTQAASVLTKEERKRLEERKKELADRAKEASIPTTTSTQISKDDIDWEKSNITEQDDIDAILKVVVLERRGKNANGIEVGTVRVFYKSTPENPVGGNNKMEVFFKSRPTPEPPTSTTEDVDDNEVVGERLASENTTNTTDKDQSVLSRKDDMNIEINDPERSIKSKINVVMMKIFRHYFDEKTGKFRFRHSRTDGLPSGENNSNIDVTELARIRKGDKVEIVRMNISDEARQQYEENKEASLKHKDVKAEDFDDVHLGILSEGKLIGFVQQPHTTENSTDKTASQELRQALIAYRRAVIAKILNGETVQEEITAKGNGNLHTKLKTEKGKEGLIDASRKVLETARQQDIINGALVFAYANKTGKLIIKPGSITEKNRRLMQDSLSSFAGYKTGSVFQVVHDLTGNFGLVPVYAAPINAITLNELLRTIDSFTDKTKPGEMVSAINDYIYASATNKKATVFIHNFGKDKATRIKIGRHMGPNGEGYTINEIRENKNGARDEVKKLLLNTRMQNINVHKINRIEYQKSLQKRETLVSNVMEFMGEYYVQPYLEYSQTTNTGTKKGPVAIEATTPPSLPSPAPIRDAKGRFKKVDNVKPKDAPLSRTKNFGKPINRSNFKKWLNEHAPQLQLSDVEALADLKLNIKGAFGMFKDMTVYLFDGAGTKTGYHEAFHGVFRSLLTPVERNELLEEAAKRFKAPTTTDLMRLQETLSKEYTAEQLTYLYYEEKLADAFAEYTESYKEDTLWDKLKAFFNKIFKFVNIFTQPNQDKIDELFHRINAKEFTTKKVIKTTPTALDLIMLPFENFLSEYAYSKELDEVFGSSTAKMELVKGIGNQFMSMYQKAINAGEKRISSSKIFDDILEKFANFLDDAEDNPGKYTEKEIEHANRVGTNFEDIKKEVAKYLSYRHIKFTNTLEVEEDETLINESPTATEENPEGDVDDADAEQSRTVKGLGEWTAMPGLNSASKRLKMFFSSIPVMENDEVKTDIYGIEQFYDFSKMYYYIERNLTGLYTIEDQLDYLSQLAENRPEIASVIKKLTIKPSNVTQEQFDLLRNDFKTNFSKQQLAYTMVQFDTNKGRVQYKIFEPNRKDIGRQTLTEWEENRKDPNNNTIAEKSNTGDIKYFSTQKAKDLLTQWEAIIKKFPERETSLNVKTINSILNKVGIEYSPEVIEKLAKKNHPEFRTAVTDVLTYYAADNTADAEKDGRQALSLLVAYEVNARFDNYTSSFNNVENKAIYTIQLPSYASKLLAKLTSDREAAGGLTVATNTIESLRRDPFYKFSNLLNDLATGSLTSTQFKMSYIDGLKDKRGNSDGAKFTTMSPKDYLAMQFALFQNKFVNKEVEDTEEGERTEGTGKVQSANISKYVYLTASDKTMAMIFDCRRYGVNLEQVDNHKEIMLNSDILTNKFYNVFLSQAVRIRKNLDLKNDILANKDNAKVKLIDLIEHYHVSKKNYSTLTTLAKKQQDGQMTDIDWATVGSLFDGQAFTFNYFGDRFTKGLREANLEKLINESTVDTLEDIFENTITNEAKGITAREEIYKLLKPELNARYRNTLKEMIAKGVIKIDEKTGLYTNIALELNAKTPEAIHEEIQQLTAEFSLNEWLHNIELSNLLNGDYAQYKPGDLQKRTHQSQSMFTNNNFKGRKIRTIVIKDVEVPSEAVDNIREALKKQGFSKKEIDEIFPIVDKDGKADKYGKVNVTDAQVYVTPEFYKAIHVARGTWTDDMQLAYDVAEGIIDINKLSDFQRKNIRVKLGAIKPFYYGDRYDEALEMYRHEQVKCSMIPLFKSYTAINPLLAERRATMEANKVDMLAHESAFKAAIGFRDNINSANSTILELESDNFGVQVDNPEHIQDAENDSLRQLKMLLVGSIDPSKDYKGRNGKDIIDQILAMEATNIKVDARSLRRKMDNKTNAEFSKFVKEMVTKRGATSVIEELLKVDENGEFVYPLDGNISTTLENMLCSIFTNNVIKQAFAEGGSGVQATSLGFKYKSLKDQQSNLSKEALLEQQELSWIRADDDGIEYAECAMPAWTKRFFNEKGLLKDVDNIPSELREMIMYRIPTEGLHSMLPIRVVKFLPEEMGNFILLPYEVTTQFGADFDFDKMFFIAREFYSDIDANGVEQLVRYKYIDGTEPKDVEARWQQYMKYYLDEESKGLKAPNKATKREFESWPVEEQNVRPARNNVIIDNYLHLLSSLENLGLIVKPSGFKKLENVKDDYFTVQSHPSDFFTGTTQRDLKERNHIGLALKGQSALHVSGHSYAVLMKLTSFAQFTDKKGNKYLDKTKSINFNKKNKYNFSTLYTEDKSLIADELASIMAAILDDIKKPILASLGINKHTIDVLATIVRSGYNVSTAAKYTSQLGIKRVSAMLDTNYNKIKDIDAGWVNPNTVVEYYENKMKEVWEKLPDNLKNPEHEDVISGKIDRNEVLLNIKSRESAGENGGPYDHNIEESTMEYFLKEYGDNEKAVEKDNLQNRLRFYAFQMRVVKNFIHMDAIAKELVEINKFYAINKEVGPDIEDIIAKRQIYDNITAEGRIINGFNIEDIPTLKETWVVHEQALSFLEKYFPYSTPLYMQIKEHMLMWTTRKSIDKIKIKHRKWVNSFIRFYTDAKSKLFAETSDMTGELFVSLPKQLQDIKKIGNNDKLLGERTYKDIKNNLFISGLETFNDKDNGIKYIRLKANRIDLQVKEAMIGAFKSLYYDPSTHMLALRLIKHNFVYGGFFGGLNSYASLIHPEILAELGYMRYRKARIKEAQDGQVIEYIDELDNILDQAVRQPGGAKKLTKVFDASLFSIEEGEALPDEIRTSPELLGSRADDIILAREDGEPTRTARYIRLYDPAINRTMIYKSHGPDALTYYKVGYLGRNGMYLEVDPTVMNLTSVLPANKIEQVGPPSYRISNAEQEADNYEPENTSTPFQEDVEPNFDNVPDPKDPAEDIDEKLKNVDVPASIPPNDPKNFTGYSGGAKGSDTFWAIEAATRGIKQVNYTPNDLTRLTPEQTEEVEREYQKIVKQLGRKPLEAGTYVGGLVRRDYLQAKAGDAIFAIVEGFERNGRYVKGGTAYAVTAAMNMGKPIYVFDQSRDKWYYSKYENGEFSKWIDMVTPMLTPKYTGIGTRQLQANGEQAIRDVFNKTFPRSEGGKPSGLDDIKRCPQ